MSEGIRSIIVVGYLASLPLAWLATVYADARGWTPEIHSTPAWLAWPLLPLAIVACLAFHALDRIADGVRNLGAAHRPTRGGGGS